ncbi:unnamed protein product [Anisakis simplex]|uniref:Transposase n=1 Tax=Anisakis simplex TaxID=6269 RepID=A0A0M3JBX3_ANISI|nr:unnamed protein product [Anisakis simplex]
MIKAKRFYFEDLSHQMKMLDRTYLAVPSDHPGESIKLKNGIRNSNHSAKFTIFLKVLLSGF